MIFEETKLPGAYVIGIDPFMDERGFFARSFCRREFADKHLNADFVQCNISFNAKRGTLRGMHYQQDPYQEAKLIRCTSGSIYDVIIDLRPGSVSYLEWIAVELNAEERKMLYVPENFAHGFITLEDHTEVFYQMSEYYAPKSSGGLRWDDPLFNIHWPVPVEAISQRDQGYPDFLP